MGVREQKKDTCAVNGCRAFDKSQVLKYKSLHRLRYLLDEDAYLHKRG